MSPGSGGEATAQDGAKGPVRHEASAAAAAAHDEQQRRR